VSVVILDHPRDREENDHIAVVRINRPDALNALNLEVRQELARVFRELTEDDDVLAVVLTGDEKAFAAGADLKDMADRTTVEMFLRRTERLWQNIADYPKPVIAAINGYALGGGLELAMHSDIIVIGETAQVGQPEVRVGIMPGAGGTQRLTRAVGKFQAMRLCLTGRPIDGKEAFAIGLASQVVPDAEVYETAYKMAKDITRMPPIAVQQIKSAIIRGQDASLDTGMALERAMFQGLFATADQSEGMHAFIEKRRPNFKGE
jgi:enoyl-CoA hydratase